MHPHDFLSSYDRPALYRIGKRYVCCAFAKKDVAGRSIPFCKTKDGKNVDFKRGNAGHVLTKKNDLTGFRESDLQRIRRLVWIKPILEGKVEQKVYWIEEEKQRVYYLLSKNYKIILDIKADGSLRLSTAYTVTDSWGRKKIKRQFKL